MDGNERKDARWLRGRGGRVGRRLDSHHADIAIIMARVGDRGEPDDAHVGNDARHIVAIAGDVVRAHDRLCVGTGGKGEQRNDERTHRRSLTVSRGDEARLGGVQVAHRLWIGTKRALWVQRYGTGMSFA